MTVAADIHLPPIAPGRRPIIGHAIPLIKDRLAFLQAMRAHGPLVRVAVGPKALLLVNSPELIHELLTSRSNQTTKGLLFEKLKIFGADALPVAEGAHHRNRRRLIQPAFHRAKIETYVEAMRTTVQTAIDAWPNGAILDMKTEMQVITQGVVMSAAFSSNPDPALAREILGSVDLVFRAALQRALLPVAALERLPTRHNRRVVDASRTLRTAVGKIITDHRAHPDAYDDVVSLLLAARDETGASLPDDDILSEVTGLLAAGSETTAVVLAWLFHELGQSPDLEHQLHDEVDAVLAGNPPTADHLPRLGFTRRLVKETLRLYSPAWLVTRQASSDLGLGDFTVPAGTDLIWSPYTLHRDPALFADPERFDPDRWLEERPQPPRGAFIPFGTGKRQCLGDGFAWTEATLATALIASRWRLRPTDSATVRPIGEITVHPSQLHMTTQARHVQPRGTA
ncbi:cytochrome P450 [Streptomyces sp. NPDC004237]|uniref:cytochrome P450 n=1 Tax=Streptomyces sp. NPDC004237 TaxID=3154455 RepID=UPI0033AA342C